MLLQRTCFFISISIIIIIISFLVVMTDGCGQKCLSQLSWKSPPGKMWGKTAVILSISHYGELTSHLKYGYKDHNTYRFQGMEQDCLHKTQLEIAIISLKHVLSWYTWALIVFFHVLESLWQVFNHLSVTVHNSLVPRLAFQTSDASLCVEYKHIITKLSHFFFIYASHATLFISAFEDNIEADGFRLLIDAAEQVFHDWFFLYLICRIENCKSNGTFVSHIQSFHTCISSLLFRNCFYSDMNPSISFVFIFSNGQYVVAGSDDGSFFIWDKNTSNIIRVLHGDESIVNCLQPHPNTCLLATSGIDPVVRLWSPRPEVSVQTGGKNHYRKSEESWVFNSFSKDTGFIFWHFLQRKAKKKNYIINYCHIIIILPYPIEDWQ